MDAPDLSSFRAFLLDLQDRICAAVEEVDGAGRFLREEIPRPGGGLSRPRVLDGGAVIERGAVQFSHTVGEALPPTATTRRPELAGQGFEAASVSLILHPQNPFAPTTHANFRAFATDGSNGAAAWWFGGGFDLTPVYGFVEDAVHWHQVAADACSSYGEDVYPRMKAACDEYFWLPHRKEPRGIGGIFFDDLSEGGFARCEGLARALADAFLPAYMPILERRKDTPFTAEQRDFQLYRRGRYVEFNLAWDRGTRFGLQAGARTESLLASLPPVVHWRYDWSAEPGTPEAELVDYYLQGRDWLGEHGQSS